MRRALILGGLCSAITALLMGCAAAKPERFTVDLQRCLIQGHSLDEVMRWTPDTIDFDSPRYKLFERLSLAGPQAGVYLGHCTIDNVTGQAMVIDLRQVEGQLQLVPPVDSVVGHAGIEQFFGAPAAAYRSLGPVSAPTGSRGEWRNVCPGYSIKIQFDVRQLPRSITVQPL